MIRWTDIIGVVGFALVVLSTLLFFPSSADRMNWKYWLAGLSVWFLGFSCVVGWLLSRWSMRLTKDGPPPALIWSAPHSQERAVTSDVDGTDLHSKKAA
jgi:hypothetical protein